MNTKNPQFTVRIASLVRGGEELLKHVQFSCIPGSTTVVIGENGAGKSMLLRAAAGVIDGAMGSIQTGHFSGDLSGAALPFDCGLWPRLTIVHQSNVMFPTMTVRKQLELAHAQSVNAGIDCKRTVDDVVDLFDLRTIASRRPSNLSGGEKQRVAIARGVIANPDILLLDEPTAALDVSRTEQLMGILKNYAQDGGCLIIATHSVGVIRSMADSCIFLESRMICDSGEISDLERNGTPQFRKFWKTMTG